MSYLPTASATAALAPTTAPVDGFLLSRIPTSHADALDWCLSDWLKGAKSPGYYRVRQTDLSALDDTIPGTLEPVARPAAGECSKLWDCLQTLPALPGGAVALVTSGAKFPLRFRVQSGALIPLNCAQDGEPPDAFRARVSTLLGIPNSEDVALMAAAGGPQQGAAAADEPIAVIPWPTLLNEALYGLAGDVVRLATNDSEADPAAVLITFLTYFGAAVGKVDGQTPYISVGETRHPTRLFSAIVGKSSRARKGTSASPVRRIMELSQMPDPTSGNLAAIGLGPPACPVCEGPLSSGEGIIFRLRDPSEELEEETNRPAIPGAEDKRLMVIESELGSALKVSQREGNIVSTTLRVAWDGGVIEPLTKTARIKSSYPHLSVVGHITNDELKSLLTSVDLRNGLVNRFLWVCARRSKLVSRPSPMPEYALNELSRKVRDALRVAIPAQLALSEASLTLWDDVYPVLTEDRPGAWGFATARAEVQVLRLAMLYALLDCSSTITPDHLTAACALWKYCDESAFRIFGGAEADPTANKILEALAAAPGGELSQSDIKQRVLQGHAKAGTVATVLQSLQDAGRIQRRDEKTGGRPVTLWSLCVKSVESVESRDGDRNVPDLMRILRFLRSKQPCGHEPIGCVKSVESVRSPDDPDPGGKESTPAVGFGPMDAGGLNTHFLRNECVESLDAESTPDAGSTTDGGLITLNTLFTQQGNDEKPTSSTRRWTALLAMAATAEPMAEPPAPAPEPPAAEPMATEEPPTTEDPEPRTPVARTAEERWRARHRAATIAAVKP